jgi:hypothetical protein
MRRVFGERLPDTKLEIFASVPATPRPPFSAAPASCGGHLDVVPRKVGSGTGALRLTAISTPKKRKLNPKNHNEIIPEKNMFVSETGIGRGFIGVAFLEIMVDPLNLLSPEASFPALNNFCRYEY